MLIHGWERLSARRPDADQRRPGGRFMTSFEGDTTGPRDEAAGQLASAASGPVASAQDADLNYWESAENTVLAAGATDDRFSRRFLEASGRRVIAAWAKAVGGDEGALAAVARPEAVQALLHPAEAGQRARVIVRGLRVTQISVMRLRTDTEPPQLGITFCYIGRRSIEDGDAGPVLSGERDTEEQFFDFWELALDGPAPWPWRLASGYTRTFDELVAYTFTCRRETPGEYCERTGAMTVPQDRALPVRRFQLSADFAEHDARFGGSMVIIVEQDVPPTRQQAEKIMFPVMCAEITKSLGKDEWRPSLSRLEVRELLD